MATLGIHKDFLLEFARLEKTVQKRVHEVFDKFREHRHAGLHLEKLENPATRGSAPSASTSSCAGSFSHRNPETASFS